MKRNPVTLDIGRVSLEGFSLNAHQAGQVRRGMQRELERLIRADGLPPRGMHTPSVTAPYLPASSTRPVELGRQIAKSVYATLHATV